MLKITTLEGMQTILDKAYRTPAKDIAVKLLHEVQELIVVLEDLKGPKSCFCSMPVHTSACSEGLRWLKNMQSD